jgi:hypothetical protein
MKKYLLLALISLCYLSCKKLAPAESGLPSPTLKGTWKETVLYNYFYTNNALARIDTIPIMSNKAALYSIFNDDGTFESYTMNGSNKADTFSGTFWYYADKKILEQIWPPHNSITTTTGNTTNMDRLADGTFVFTSEGFLYIYNIVTLDSKNLFINAKVMTFGDMSEGNYQVQMRKMVKE